MKCFMLILQLILQLIVVHAFDTTHTTITMKNLVDKNNIEQFELFKIKYDKNYTSKSEMIERYAIFLTNMLENDQHNTMPNVTYERGITQFSDLTINEFREKHEYNENYYASNDLSQNCITLNKTTLYIDTFINMKVPNSLDWRNYSHIGQPTVIGSVRNQGECKASWAFAAIAAVESNIAILGRKFSQLSEQQLIDCSTKWGNNGCKNGSLENAYRYIIDNSDKNVSRL